MAITYMHEPYYCPLRKWEQRGYYLSHLKLGLEKAKNKARAIISC